MNIIPPATSQREEVPARNTGREAQGVRDAYDKQQGKKK
jgi:hypothetical protein